MAQFILRVDDCGWVPPDKRSDVRLDYFRSWRDAFGIAGLPVYYGFIPKTLGVGEIAWLYGELTEEEQVAVHGWDHERGPVSRDKMFLGCDILRAAGVVDSFEPPYIPPFNAYDEQTLRDWSEAAVSHYGSQTRPIFFGGFPDDPQSLNHGGEHPCLVEGQMLHLPAFRPLYGRCDEVLARLDEFLHVEHPLVVTLHVTWDVNHFDSLRPLRDKLAPHLVPASAARDWLRGRDHA